MSENKQDITIKGDPGTRNSFTEITVKEGGVYQYLPGVTTLSNTTEKFRPLVITDIIKALADPSLRTPNKRNFNTKLFDFTPKVNFNRLVRWAETINKLKEKTIAVEKIYKEFDRQAMDVSEAVLDWLHDQYDQLRGQYDGDELFDEIQKRVYHYVNHDPQLDDGMRMEVLNYNIRIVLVDAFMKCSIFEKPI